MAASESILSRGMVLKYDVIVSAGPAGSTTARFCAKKGLKALLIEKDRFPRYKPCGGCLSPRVLRELDFDIGRVIENTVSEAKFTFQLRDRFSICSQNPIGYLVMRDSFDQLLCRKAQEGGANLFEGKRVIGFQQDAEGVDVYINGGGIREVPLPRWGRWGPQHRGSITPWRGGEENGHGIGERGTFGPGNKRKSSFVHLDFGGIPNGYGWIFPKGDFVSIGICALLPSKGMKLKTRFDRIVASVDYVAEIRVEKACFYPLPTVSSDDLPYSKGRVLLVGHAANLMDPMMGEGIYYAIRSGQIAPEAIVKAIKEDEKGISGYHRRP